ncbi:PKD domain-containing protein [Lunatibacter salilacus]|uniref:PKD domain-containing protein n=1 Tax=Lunatibacter salilacus TaxID=2483804 RepID=UPI00131BA5B9|nr:hypothetical protein [Lunatibacter salilacus]
MKKTNSLLSHYLKFFILALILSTVGFVSCIEDEDDIEVAVNGLIANAGFDQSVAVYSTVTLDGSESYDENEGNFSYYWAFISKPSQSGSTLNNHQSMTSEFIPDQEGVFTLTLTISQASFTARDTVSITTTGTNEPSTVVIDQDIATPTILANIFDDETPDYMVTRDIHVSTQLTIEPGVKVVFAENKGLIIGGNGSLKAIGESENKVLFIGTEPSNNFWKGILIASNSEHNEFKHAEVRGGGSSDFPTMPGITANVILEDDYMSGSALKLSHTRLTHSGGYGLFVGGQSYLNEFRTLIFEENAKSAAYIPAHQLHMVDFDTDFYESNGYRGIETGGVIDNSTPVRIPKINAQYLVSNDIIIKSGVEIAPGSYFMMKEGVSIQVVDQGYFNAVGTAEEKITLTSTSTNQHWDGILIDTNHELNKIHFCEVNYAGKELLPGMSNTANLATNLGLISVKNSYFSNGLGYGIVVSNKVSINADVSEKNEFFNFPLGYLFPSSLYYPDLPALAGEWVDEWSLTNNHFSVDRSVYDKTSGVWFNGADGPWTMQDQGGYGLVISEDGNYLWTAAINTSNSGCPSYNAEYMTGKAIVVDEKATFELTYWRSKFVSECDPTQNVDESVDTYTYELRYEINKVYDTWSGEPFWKLTFFNPDNSTFSYYKK